MRKLLEFFLPLIIALGVSIVALGLLSSDAFGQNPTGDRNWPIWTRTAQGTSIAYGSVDCEAGGSTFAGGGQSLMMQNIGSDYITVCPDGGSCTTSTGWRIAEGAALILDKANAGASVWKCFGNGSTRVLRYIMEK